ncbi:hypothetical protein [Kordia sp.]|uniref:hypothetical protein n=1 Tax=Kordia sp. TaxID=1965332 RepID=UPI003D6A9946
MEYTIKAINTIAKTNKIIHLKTENDFIYVLSSNKKILSLEIYNLSDFSLHNTILLKVKGKKYKKVYDFQYFPKTNQYCICFEYVVALFDEKGKLIKKLKIEDGVLSSKYFSSTEIFLELYEFSGNRLLGIWELTTNKLKEYELESYYHYNRNFKIDASNTILYGTANAYWSGIHLHVLNFEKEKLSYLYEKGLRCSRSEIEAYAISINSIGDEYVFISENDNGKIPLLCYYSVYKQNKPKGEFKLYEHSNILSNYKTTSFLFDHLLVIVSEDKFAFLNPENSSEKKKNLYELFDRSKNSSISIDNINGRIVYIQDKNVMLCSVLNMYPKLSKKRKMKMNNFLNDIQNAKFEVKEVGSDI